MLMLKKGVPEENWFICAGVGYCKRDDQRQ
jgi:hypothetical protein